jgi:hypothetical protein
MLAAAAVLLGLGLIGVAALLKPSPFTRAFDRFFFWARHWWIYGTVIGLLIVAMGLKMKRKDGDR